MKDQIGKVGHDKGHVFPIRRIHIVRLSARCNLGEEGKLVYSKSYHHSFNSENVSSINPTRHKNYTLPNADKRSQDVYSSGDTHDEDQELGEAQCEVKWNIPHTA